MSYPLPLEGFKLVSAEASNEQIAELVGMSFEIFTNTVMFCQQTRGRNVTDFMDASDTDRKGLFSALFGLECYEQALELVKPDTKATRVACETLETSLQKSLTLREASEAERTRLKAGEEEFLRRKAEQLQELTLEIERLQAAYDQVPKVREVEVEKARDTCTLARSDFERALQELNTKRAAFTTLQSHKGTDEITLIRLKGTAYVAPTEPPKSTGMDLVALQAECSLVEERLEQFAAYRAQMEEEQRTYQSRLSQTQSALSRAEKQLEEALTSKFRVETQRTQLQAQLDQIQKCPTCQQEFATPQAKEVALADLHRRIKELVDVNVGPLQERVQTLTDELSKIVAPNQAEYKALLEAVQADTTRKAALQQGINAYHKATQAYAVYQTQVENYNTRMETLRLQEQELEGKLKAYDQQIPPLQTEIEARTTLVAQLQEAWSKATADVSRIQTLLGAGKPHLEALESAQRRYQDLEKPYEIPSLKAVEEALTNLGVAITKEEGELITKRIELTILESLEEAFGSEGIVAELFREYIPDIQRVASELLLDLTNGELEIVFSPQKVLKGKGTSGTGLRAQFDIDVQKRNGGSSYELVSGSEQNKAALVVSWALSELAYNHSNIWSNLRVFDEAFEALDLKGMERLAGMISRKAALSKQLTLVITHKSELDDYFVHKIILEKKSGTSRIAQVL